MTSTEQASLEAALAELRQRLFEADYLIEAQRSQILDQRRLVNAREQERDEARIAARQLFEAAAMWGSFPPGGKALWTQELGMRWPWLKGDDGDR